MRQEKGWEGNPSPFSSIPHDLMVEGIDGRFRPWTGRNPIPLSIRRNLGGVVQEQRFPAAGDHYPPTIAQVSVNGLDVFGAHTLKPDHFITPVLSEVRKNLRSHAGP